MVTERDAAAAAFCALRPLRSCRQGRVDGTLESGTMEISKTNVMTDRESDMMCRGLLITLTAVAVLPAGAIRADYAPTLLGLSYSRGLSFTLSFTDPLAVAADERGAVVVGAFRGSVDFDPGDRDLILTNGFGLNTFVASYSPAGRIQWAQAFVGLHNEPADVSLDPQGNLIVTGFFYSTITVGVGADITELTAAGSSSDAYIIKFDRSGHLLWAVQEGRHGSWGNSVATDSSSSIWVATRFQLLRLSEAGAVTWQRDIPYRAFAIEVGPDDSLYVTGDYSPGRDFDPGPAVHTLPTVGYVDVFVLRLTSAGEFVWVVSGGGTGQDGGFSLSVDTSGAVAIAGRYDGTADFDPDPTEAVTLTGPYASRFLWKLSSEGTLEWVQDVPLPGRLRVAGPGNGDLQVVGSFQGTIDFGDAGKLVSHGKTDAALVEISPTGVIRSAARLGGIKSDEMSAVAAYGPRVYSTGIFSSPGADLDPSDGETSIDPTGGSDMFLVVTRASRVQPIPATSALTAALLILGLSLAALWRLGSPA